MIEFDLGGLHPSYDRVVRDVFRGLIIDYPVVRDLRVTVYEHEGDESIGCSPVRGCIRLNARWFGRSVEELRQAALADDLVRMAAGPPIPWHGRMEEPVHFLTHEFGHQLQFAIPGWRKFSERHWHQACDDPGHCRPPTGYALCSADEFWADCFSAHRLGYECEAGRLVGEFLSDALSRPLRSPLGA